jgi:hypothetical protein
MTREELITLAHKANINVHTGKSFAEDLYIDKLERFAAVVAQHERQACIQLLEQYEIPCGNSGAGELAAEWTYDALKTIRDEIRERAQA